MPDQATTINDLKALFDEVQVLCGGIDDDLYDELEGLEDRFSDEELRELLTTILTFLRTDGDPSPEERGRLAAEVRESIEAVIQKRHEVEEAWGDYPDTSEEEAGPANGPGSAKPHLELFDYDGFEVRNAPTSTFLGKTIPLQEGFTMTKDIEFWQENKRLKIDLENFRRKNGRKPEPEELRQMLWPKGSTGQGDPYEIRDLADDIAARGVTTPPVIDWEGIAWDGNRRLAACLFILSSDDYDSTQKERASRVRVWQTGPHATKDQITAIVTSLNFGKEFKKPWPEYVRARDVYDAFVDLRELEASKRTLTERDETKIRSRVAKKFGIKTQEVTRYCKMVNWALEFEDFHRDQGRDENEISSRTAELFQYFFELDAGIGEDKLTRKFDGDESFRAIVFDLLFDGKIKNFSQVRELRRVYDTPEALEQLKEAHAEPSRAVGQAGVGDAIFTARKRSEDVRKAGKINDLAAITKWLNEDVTLSLLSKLDVRVLREFRDAARAVDGMITKVVDGTVMAVPDAS